MPALVALLACTVIGIADGDTLTARCDAPEGKVNITVRVAEIDAPEKGQAYGTRSRQHLAELCHGKAVKLSPRTIDRYGRTVARVECDGMDASTEQVRAGMAWVFDKYVSDRACTRYIDPRPGASPVRFRANALSRGSCYDWQGTYVSLYCSLSFVLLYCTDTSSP